MPRAECLRTGNIGFSIDSEPSEEETLQEESDCRRSITTRTRSIHDIRFQLRQLVPFNFQPSAIQVLQDYGQSQRHGNSQRASTGNIRENHDLSNYEQSAIRGIPGWTREREPLLRQGRYVFKRIFHIPRSRYLLPRLPSRIRILARDGDSRFPENISRTGKVRILFRNSSRESWSTSNNLGAASP